MPLQHAESPPHPSRRDARSADSSSQEPAETIRFVFLESEPSQTFATGLPRFRTESVAELSEASAQVATLRPDLVLLHHSAALPAAVEALRRHDRQLPIIVVVPAAERAGDMTIEAVRAGASEVVSESTPADRVREIIGGAVQRRRLQKRPSVRIHDPATSESGAGSDTVGAAILGSCDAMIEVLCTIARAAAGDYPLLIHGGPGTGKSLTAMTLHRYSSRGPQSPSVIDCGHCQADCIDRLLFEDAGEGIQLHRAHHGRTLIIENLDHASPRTQRRLLAAIQHQVRLPADAIGTSVRLVLTCSTAIASPNMRARTARSDAAGTGLLDELYFELSGHALWLPPLCDRGQDIATLIDHFVRSLTATEPLDEGDSEHRITPDAKAALLAYDWPGNVTQLRSVVLSELRLGDGAIVLGSRLSKTLSLADRSLQSRPAATFPTPMQPPGADVRSLQSPRTPQLQLAELRQPQLWAPTVEQFSSDTSGIDDTASLYGDAIHAVEAGLITAVLEKTDGNLAQSARLLGITRVSLRRKIHTLSLNIPGRAGR